MEELIVGFDYTIWANKRWLAALDNFKDRERAERVMRHMAFWQRNWLKRASLSITGEDVDLLEDVPVGESLERGARDWQAFLFRHADQDVSFVRTEGGAMKFRLHMIAKQLIGHGFYHRGHLRGLADAEGLEDFPDTDWFFYCIADDR